MFSASPRWLRSFASEAFRLALLSLASLGLGYVLTLALHAAGLAPETAFGCAVLICSVLNFFGCRHYVFRGPKPAAWREAVKFFPAVLAFRAMEVALFALLNATWDSHHLAYFATSGIGMASKLLVSRLFIFKRKPQAGST